MSINAVLRTTQLLTLCVVLVLGFSSLADPAFAADEHVSFNIAQEVPAEDAAYIREGIALAQRYVAETLTDISDKPVYLAAYDNDTFYCGPALACANERSIVVLAGTMDWNSLSAFERVETIVHEYIHVYQFAMLGDEMETMPAWFIEGMAEYLGFDAVVKLGLVRARDVHDVHVWTLAWSPGMPPLEEMENDNAFYSEGTSSYSFGYLALDELMKDRPLSDLDRFLKDIRVTHSWRTSFARVFALDLNAFYRSIAIASDEYVAPRKMPTPFTPAGAEFVESPLSVESVSPSVAAGEQLTVLARAEAAAVCRIQVRDGQSGNEESRTTFADASGRLFWLITIPESFNEGPATITAACGGDKRTVEIEIAA